jgi:hypothetical protein
LDAKKHYATFNLEQNEDSETNSAYFSREEFEEFIAAFNVTDYNVPKPTERGKLVYHNSYGNDTNSSTIAVWYIPVGRDTLDENDPNFNDDGPESEFGEPTVLIVMHNADWSGLCYIPMQRAQTIYNHIKSVMK